MTEDQDQHNKADSTPDHTMVDMGYPGSSAVASRGSAADISLFTDTHRAPVSFNGKIKDPMRFREAAAALYAIVSSDYRYVPKDRSAYLAYSRLRRESANLSAWEAQQAYFDWLARNDPTAFLILDPVICVHPDKILLEVFSKDEGAYACLGIGMDAFQTDQAAAFGTTNMDFSRHLYDGIQKIRSHKETSISIGSDALTLQAGDEKVLEKKISLPDSWLRGFLQVQSAATLPHDTIRIAPMDVYNMLRHLRLHKDVKRKRRALRIELVPGAYPRLVLEPWETAIETSQEIFKGRRSKVVRVWGRRRLMLIRRLLPFVDTIDVHLCGSGLPSFWVFKAGDVTLTLGLTGFTSANWSRALGFDLLLPRKVEATQDLEAVLAHLETVWLDSFSAISTATGLSGATLLKTLQLGCQQGAVMYDIAADVYRLRPLLGHTIALGRLEFRNQHERRAHDLLHRKGAVTIESINRIYGSGIELTGSVRVSEDKREYRPLMLIDDDGQVVNAQCTCTHYRKKGLTKGPCPHLIALRLKHALDALKQMKSGQISRAVTMETRTYFKRRGQQENVCQITLNKERLKIRWGTQGEGMRVSNVHFNTVDEARSAYGDHVARLEQNGYLDATAG
ncbi:hypothetical protein [Desulfosarcina variabilis]|uniref:hypothetical protein n=1 Tax=Desulfosarcina variabilis TaxID=2300 RepID=UPI003AFAF16A